MVDLEDPFADAEQGGKRGYVDRVNGDSQPRPRWPALFAWLCPWSDTYVWSCAVPQLVEDTRVQLLALERAGGSSWVQPVRGDRRA